MAVAATTVWEMRASGSATNGGGFNSARGGTDYSQQDTAHASGTDLASTNGTTNPSVVTSASYTFVASDAGNIIAVSAGTSWTIGWYEIVSVSGGAATLDRAVGSAATLTAGTWALGGAYNLASGPATWLATINAGNKIWVKYGTYTYSANANHNLGFTSTNLGTDNLWIFMEGYYAQRGDKPSGTLRPTISYSGIGTNAQLTCCKFSSLSNLILTTSGGSVSLCVGTNSTAVNGGGGPFLADNCKFTVTGNTATVGCVFINQNTGDPSVDGAVFTGCEFVGLNQSCWGIKGQGPGNVILIGCHFHNLGSVAFFNNVANIHFYTFDCLIVDSFNPTQGGTTSTDAVFSGCTFYGAESKNTSTEALGWGGLSFTPKIYNNIFYGWTTAISDASTAYQTIDYNCFYNNGTNRVSGLTGPHDVTVNPNFANLRETAGSLASVSSTVLTCTNADFTGVVDFQDYVNITVGATTTGYYQIIAHTATTLTLNGSPGGTFLSFYVTSGRNFSVGTNLKALGFPGVFPAGLSSSALDIGMIQRIENSAGAFRNPSINNGMIRGKPKVRS